MISPLGQIPTEKAEVFLKFLHASGRRLGSLNFIVDYVPKKAEILRLALQFGYDANEPFAIKREYPLEYMASEPQAFGAERNEILLLFLQYRANINLLPNELQGVIRDELSNISRNGKSS